MTFVNLLKIIFYKKEEQCDVRGHFIKIAARCPFI